MYTMSTAFNNACLDSGRTIYTKCEFVGQTHGDETVVLYGDGSDGSIVSIVFAERLDTSNGLSMGNTIANELTMVIRKPSYSLAYTSQTIKPYVGLMIGNSIEWCPLGVFYIDEATSTSGNVEIRITARDMMSRLTADTDLSDIGIDLSANPPPSIADILNAIGTKYGFTVTQATQDLVDDMTISVLYESTYKDFIGWMAGLVGKHARFDRLGALEFVYYVTYVESQYLTDSNSANLYDSNNNQLRTVGTNFAIDITSDYEYLGGTKQADNTYTLSSITSGTEDAPLTVGSGRGISFTNPYMTQALLDAIGNDVLGTSFAPITTKWRGNPALQTGDTIRVAVGTGSVISVVMEHTLTITGGMYDTISCYAVSDGAFAITKSPTEKKIQQAFTTLQQAIADATALINGTKGGIFVVTDNNGDGVNDGWEIRESADTSFHGNCIVANHNGIGFSSDGGQTYNVAITTGGQINADYITTGHISAERVLINGKEMSEYINIATDEGGNAYIEIGKSDGIRLRLDNDQIVFCNQQGDELAYWKTDRFYLSQIANFQIGDVSIVQHTRGSVSFVKGVVS